MAEEISKENTPSEPKKPTELVVRNSDGVTFSTRLKDEKGKFVKKEKTMTSSRELTRRGRLLLLRKRKDTIDIEGKPVTVSQYDAMTQYMIDIALGKVDDDPKKLTAAVLAYEKVLKRLLGTEPKSDEDREAMKDGNTIKFVLIQPPADLINKAKAQIEQPKKPAFVDAEVVQQN